MLTLNERLIVNINFKNNFLNSSFSYVAPLGPNYQVITTDLNSYFYRELRVIHLTRCTEWQS